jgi:hypothetical protein
MVHQAVEALGGSTTNVAVRQWIWNQYPGTNRGSINCNLIAGTVNHPSRIHYANIDPRPRPANNPELDRFYRPEKGRIERYDPQRHGKWEIYQTPEGRLSVRQVDEWREAPPDTRPLPKPEKKATAKQRREVEWVEDLKQQLEPALQSLSYGRTKLRIDVGYRLPYAHEVMSYVEDTPEERHAARYQTDMLIFDELDGGERWIPRVIVECKIKAVTTHDALTYSTKAATHKQVHPYLRYGMLIGNYGSAVPKRLVRHGAYFDFMAVWEDAKASRAEWEELVDVLMDEVRASRALQELLSRSSRAGRPFRMLHRPLRLLG